MKYRIRLKCDKRSKLRIPEIAEEHEKLIKTSLEASKKPTTPYKVGKN